MNILEQAEKYAEGKANQAITKAIAEAYREGYKAGYQDREKEIPVDLRDNKTEYVDLGLPSGTLWAADYEKDDDGKRLYLPYCKAEHMNLPTKEQFKELAEKCRWDIEVRKYINYNEIIEARCVGPNGQTLRFVVTGYKTTSEYTEHDNEVRFWLKGDMGNESLDVARISYSSYSGIDISYNSSLFIGYKLPIRLVR